GLNGLTQKAEWSSGAPYGPVTKDSKGQSITGHFDGIKTITGLDPFVLAQLSGPSPLGPGAKVGGTKVGGSAVFPEGTLINAPIPVPGTSVVLSFAKNKVPPEAGDYLFTFF